MQRMGDALRELADADGNVAFPEFLRASRRALDVEDPLLAQCFFRALSPSIAVEAAMAQLRRLRDGTLRDALQCEWRAADSCCCLLLSSVGLTLVAAAPQSPSTAATCAARASSSAEVRAGPAHPTPCGGTRCRAASPHLPYASPPLMLLPLLLLLLLPTRSSQTLCA